MQKKWEWPSKRKTIPKEKVLKLELEGRDIAKELGRRRKKRGGEVFKGTLKTETWENERAHKKVYLCPTSECVTCGHDLISNVLSH